MKKTTVYIDKNGCHICTSYYKTKQCYPLCKVKGKTTNLARKIYAESYGMIPDGLVIRHKCDNPSCIRLDHLEIGTVADNNWDMIERGRYKGFLRGENNAESKLSSRDVEYIKKSVQTGYALAKELGVCKKTIYNIRNGKTWKHHVTPFI